MRCCTCFLFAASAAAVQHNTRLFLNTSATVGQPNSYCKADNGMGNWGAVEQPDGSKNLCVNGKLLPELYVIGAPKCATTSLFYDLANAGVQCAGGVKEYSYWGSRMEEFITNRAPVEKEWLEGMPQCSSQKGGRQVLGDFSPGSLALGAARGAGGSAALPPILRSVYGDAHSKQINFVVMLREPLSRIHSEWYFTKDTKLVRGADAATTGVFRSDLKNWLEDPTYGFKYMASNSLYGDHLEAWLDTFPANQFVVVPYRAYVAQDGAKALCTQLSERMNFRMLCNEKVAHGLDRTDQNPPLDVDVPQDLHARFNAKFLAEKSKLVSLLAKGHSRGMTLPRYNEGSQEASVQKWLEEWW